MISEKEQIFSQIEQAKNIALVFNQDWSGDAVASGLALFNFLKKLNKQVSLFANPRVNKLYSFLPNFSEIKTNLETINRYEIVLDTSQTQIGQIKYKQEKNQARFIISLQKGFLNKSNLELNNLSFNYDLIFTIKSPDLVSLGKIYQDNLNLFYQVPIVNIDNQTNNEAYGQINLLDFKASSTAEIIFSFLKQKYINYFDQDLATCLLTGIIAETNSFKTNSLTPQTLAIVSELINYGAKHNEIITALYRNKNINTLKLWGKTLHKLKSDAQEKIIWSTLEPNDFLETKASSENLVNIIDELIINMPKALLIILIVQKKRETKTEVIVSATNNINCLELCSEFNPQGNRKLTRFTLSQPPDKATEYIVHYLQEKIKEEKIN